MELTQEQQRVLKLAKDGHSLVFTASVEQGKRIYLDVYLFINLDTVTWRLNAEYRGDPALQSTNLRWQPKILYARALLQLVSYKILYTQY